MPQYNDLKKNLVRYIMVMFWGEVLASLIFRNTTLISPTFWAINLCGLVLIVKYAGYASKEAWICAALYVMTGMLPWVFSSEYVSFSIKGFGLNAALITVPMYMIMFIGIRKYGKLSMDDIRQILELISILGIFLFIASVIYSWSDYVGLLTGKLMYFQVHSNGGLFNGKNPYGAFLSLSACCDLFLMRIGDVKKRPLRVILIMAKLLGIMLALSRASLVVLAVVGFIFLVLERKDFRREWLLLFILLAVAAVVFVCNDSIRNFLLTNVFRFGDGDSGRSVLKARALERANLSLKSILFGVGYFGIANLGIDIDNTYYYIFFSGGVIRCAIHLVLLVLGAKYVKDLRRVNTLLANAGIAMFVAYVIYAEFEAVALFELGIQSFIFMLFIYIIPNAYKPEVASAAETQIPCADIAADKTC